MLSLLPQSVDGNGSLENVHRQHTSDVPIANICNITSPTLAAAGTDAIVVVSTLSKESNQETEQEQPDAVSPTLVTEVLTCEPEEEAFDTEDTCSNGSSSSGVDGLPLVDLPSPSHSCSSAPATTVGRGKSSVDSLTKSLASCATDFRRPSTTTADISPAFSKCPTETPSSSTTKRRVVAIGDLHGDLETTKEVLHMAGLTDQAGSWCGGKDVMVQLGDVADRGPDTLALFRYLRQLQRQASQAGGEVALIMGNHELMTLMRKTSRLRLPFLRDPFSERGEVGCWLKKLPIVRVIDGTVFAHGGVSPYWAQIGCERTNRQAQRSMKSYVNMRDLNAAKVQFPVFGDNGPAWYRHYAYDPNEEKVRANLESALSSLGAKRMVVAHSPTRSSKVLVRCEGKFIDIDTKISRFFKWPDGTPDGGHLSALEIIGDRVTAIYPHGREVISEP